MSTVYLAGSWLKFTGTRLQQGSAKAAGFLYSWHRILVLHESLTPGCLVCPTPLSTWLTGCLYVTAGVLLGNLVPCALDRGAIVLTRSAKPAQ